MHICDCSGGADKSQLVTLFDLVLTTQLDAVLCSYSTVPHRQRPIPLFAEHTVWWTTPTNQHLRHLIISSHPHPPFLTPRHQHQPPHPLLFDLLLPRHTYLLTQTYKYPVTSVNFDANLVQSATKNSQRRHGADERFMGKYTPALGPCVKACSGAGAYDKLARQKEHDAIEDAKKWLSEHPDHLSRRPR